MPHALPHAGRLSVLVARAIWLVPVMACSAPGPGFPPAHPFLADSPWPTSHASTHAQGSVAAPGPTTAEGAMVEHVNLGLVSITLAVSPPYPDGLRVAWGSSPTVAYRMRLGDELELIDTVNTGAGLSDLVGGAYTLLDRDGSFFYAKGTEVGALRDEDPTRSDSPIAPAGSWTLEDPEPGEGLRGLSITWDGTLIAVSSTGRVVALRRDLSFVDELALDAEVSNSIAVDDDGGIYVVTSEAMWRVQWTGEALSTSTEDGAWSAPYDTGDGTLIGGRLGLGSGSTPSLMTVGADALVVITDAATRMRLVAFWRGEIPADAVPVPGESPRLADQIEITFGDEDRATSISEQSVLVMGDGAAVVSNDYGGAQGLEPILRGLAPEGVERVRWDASAHAWARVWARDDISCPNGIPSASGATSLMYCIGRRGPTWTLEAFDWHDGTTPFSVPLGDTSDFNSAYAATEVGPDGSILTGTLTGMVRVRTAPAP